MQDKTRRKFIINSTKITGVMIGSSILSTDLLLPSSIKAANIQFPESECRATNKPGKKILIAYASQFGTTGEVAKAIGEVLCQKGNRVDTRWIKNVQDLNNYDAVIIGSAIQYDKWMPQATEFVIENQNILSKLPVAYFFTCLTLSKKTKKTEQKAKAYSDKIYSLVPQVKPVSVGRFAGVLDYSKMSFFTSIILKIMLSILGVSEGDYRDWDAIQSWANRLSLKLQNKQA